MRKEVKPMKMNLQFFADPAPTPEPTPSGGTDPTPAPVQTFDDVLKGGFQAEFDKRVQKAINTASGKLSKEHSDILAQRDADLAALQEKLKGFEGSDAAFKELQGKYEQATKEANDKLAKQQYEFAVKTAASEIDFTSKAAKNYFISQAIEKGLSMSDDGNLLGFNDYVEMYKKEDPTAIKVVEEPTPQPTPNTPAPTIVQQATPVPTQNAPFSFLRNSTPINGKKRE